MSSHGSDFSSFSAHFWLVSEGKRFDLSARMSLAKEVRGNFFDHFLIDDDHLTMVIADISG